MGDYADYRLYWEGLWRRIPWMLCVSFGLAIVAYIVVRQMGPTYRVQFSYLVSLSAREPAEEFRFDGYYAIQATDLFAATVAQWAKTPEVIVAAYTRAGLEVPTDDPRQLAKFVETGKTAPQLIQVTVSEQDEERARRLAQGLRDTVADNVAHYHDEGIPALQFRVVATEPWVGVTRPALPLIVVATFVFSFFALVNGWLLLASLRRAEA